MSDTKTLEIWRNGDMLGAMTSEPGRWAVRIERQPDGRASWVINCGPHPIYAGLLNVNTNAEAQAMDAALDTLHDFAAGLAVFIDDIEAARAAGRLP